MSLIESVSGILTAKNPTGVQIQIGGIVYNLNISNKDNANIHCMIARVQFQIQSN